MENTQISDDILHTAANQVVHFLNRVDVLIVKINTCIYIYIPLLKSYVAMPLKEGIHKSHIYFVIVLSNK